MSGAGAVGANPRKGKELRLPGDATAWRTLHLRTENGYSVDPEHEKTIIEVANEAIATGDGDPARILEVAELVGRRAHLVDNLRAYAVRAIDRVKNGAKSQYNQEEQLMEGRYATLLADGSHVEKLEKKILLKQLLQTLAPLDRDIFLRRMDGMTCAEIDVAMKLKPRTAEIRSDICKNALRKASQERSKSKAEARGC